VTSRHLITISILVIFTAAPRAVGQSSSLYLQPAAASKSSPPLPPPPLPPPPGSSTSFPPRAPGRRPPVLSGAVSRMSFVAVGRPAPARFAKHDLITIIIRESVTNNAQSKLETEKTYKNEGKISQMPKLRLRDLLDLQVEPSNLAGREPQVGVELDNQWEGEGTLQQRNTITARITARIIDIKPNQTLVLEARKAIRTDGEAFRMVVTGTCRLEDITADNTVLSTRLYDLDVLKEHVGELRRASKKGFLTNVFDTIFNF